MKNERLAIDKAVYDIGPDISMTVRQQVDVVAMQQIFQIYLTQFGGDLRANVLNPVRQNLRIEFGQDLV